MNVATYLLLIQTGNLRTFVGEVSLINFSHSPEADMFRKRKVIRYYQWWIQKVGKETASFFRHHTKLADMLFYHPQQ